MRMSDYNRPGAPRRQLSEERRAAYYIGIAVMVIGILVFGSIFLTAASGMSGQFGMPIDTGSMVVRAMVGMGMMLGGRLLMNMGARGLAGSGVVLDPQKAREDLEPWSRMAGGVVSDALEETGLKPGNGPQTAPQTPPAQGAGLPFDEKLRRLDALRQEGLVTEEEYARKRAEILDGKW
jgi:hypothetical protein